MISYPVSSRKRFLGERLNVNFSEVKYVKIAKFVGLEAGVGFIDAPMFKLKLYRSRIPRPFLRKLWKASMT